jgi:PAS domain S-box-containing protein
MARAFRSNNLFSRSPTLFRLRGYLGAVLLVGAAVLVSLLLRPLVGSTPFLFLWPAVILSAWWGGIGAGLLAAFLAVILRDLLDPSAGLSLSLTAVNLLQLTVLSLMAIAINWFQAIQQRQTATVRREREWLSTTLASIGDGVIATDAAGNILLMNPVAVQLTGWQQSEALGRGIAEVFNIVNEATGAPVKIPIMQALEQGTVVGLANHTVLISRTGRRMPISDSGSPIRDASGKIIGAILVFRDSTEQRESELALEASEARYRALVEQASDIIYTLDVSGNITSINQAAEEVLGYSHDELLHMSMRDVLRPDDLAQAQTMMQRKVVDRETTRYVMDLIRKDGQTRTLEFNSRLELRDGQPVGVQGIARDISARKIAEARNRRLQRFAADIAGATTTAQIAGVITGLVMETFSGNLSAVFCMAEDGKALERLGTVNVDPTIIQKWPNVPFDGTTPIADAVQQKRLISIETQEEYLRLYPNLEDNIRQGGIQSAVALPFWGSRDVIGGLYVSFKSPRRLSLDDTNYLFVLAQICGQAIERAQVNQQAQENAAIEERQRLARELHDAVTQALYSSTMIAQAALRLLERDPERARQQFEQVVALNQAATADMRTLLLELRPEAIVRTALPELLNQLVQAVGGRKSMKGTFNLGGELAELTADVHLTFYRIAQESLNNVVKHSQASAFDVSLTQRDNQLILEVKDNGQGFDLSQTSGGLGLGSMRERAEAIGAALEMTSAPGQGTTMRVTWQLPPRS